MLWMAVLSCNNRHHVRKAYHIIESGPFTKKIRAPVNSSINATHFCIQRDQESKFRLSAHHLWEIG